LRIPKYHPKITCSNHMRSIFRKIPSEIKYILVLFTVTRIILTFSGVYSRHVFKNIYDTWYEWNYSKYAVLDIWSAWDSGWYLDIAENGYSPILQSDLPKRTCCGQSNIVFLPLYPMTIKILGLIINDYHSAGIVLSNFYLLLSALILHKIVKDEFGKKTGEVAVLLFFTFPTSFILSSIFSESLILLLLLLCIYFARQEKWAMASIFGFFATFTKITGLLVLPILIWEYLLKNRFQMKKDFVYFLLIPLGLIIFMLFTYVKFGNFWAYFNVRRYAWNIVPENSIEVLVGFLNSGNSALKFISYYAITSLVLMVAILFSNLPRIYKNFTLLFTVFPLISGREVVIGYPRVSVIIFPIVIFLASVITTKRSARFLTSLIIIFFTLQLLFISQFSIGLLFI